MTDIEPTMTQSETPAEGEAPAGSPAKAKAVHPRQSRQERYAHAFSQIVAVMMRDPGFRDLRLADLEWLVVPAVMSGQWRLAQMKPEKVAGKDGKSVESNVVVPVAAALWASVSPEVDKWLSEDLGKPIQLRANEWLSGNIPWLIAVAGERRAMPSFLKALQETEFKGRDVKVRARSKDKDKPVEVKMLADYAKSLG